MQLIRIAIDDVALLAQFAIVGASLDRRFQHLVRRRLCGIELDGAEPVEIEGHRAGLAEIAAELGEDRAHLACGAVAIVGERLDDHADAAGAEALVAHVLVIRPAGLKALLDGPLDIVLWHVHGARRRDRGPEPRVHGGVRHAHLRRGGDFAAELGEELGSLLVLGAFAELDVFELRMASHSSKSYWLPALSMTVPLIRGRPGKIHRGSVPRPCLSH